MCTTSALVMCIAALCGVVSDKGVQRCMEESMQIASELHGGLMRELRLTFMSVHDILSSRILENIAKSIVVEEAIILNSLESWAQECTAKSDDIMKKVGEGRAGVVTSAGTAWGSLPSMAFLPVRFDGGRVQVYHECKRRSP